MIIKIALLLDLLMVVFIMACDPTAWLAIIFYGIFILGLVITGWFRDEFKRYKKKNNEEKD